MKLEFVKFFQYVEIPVGAHGKKDNVTSANNLTHDVELDGQLIKITHRLTGAYVYATIYNASYMRPLHEPTLPEPTPGPKASDKKKTKPD